MQPLHTYRSHLEAILRRLGQNRDRTTVRELVTTLCASYDLGDIQFVMNGQPLAPETSVAALADGPFEVSLRLTCDLSGASTAAGSSRFRASEDEPAFQFTEDDPRVDAFIRELARLEDRNEFMWAGYIVRDLLPRVGFPAEQTKIVLDHLREAGIVLVEKVPNPKNPTFPATGVRLNNENERVQANATANVHQS